MVGFDEITSIYLKKRYSSIDRFITIMNFKKIQQLSALNINRLDLSLFCVYKNEGEFLSHVAAFCSILGRENITIFSDINEMSRIMFLKLARFSSVVIGECAGASELDSLLRATLIKRSCELEIFYSARKKLHHGNEKKNALMEKENSIDSFNNQNAYTMKSSPDKSLKEILSEEHPYYKLSDQVRECLHTSTEIEFANRLEHANDIISMIDLVFDSNPALNICTEYAESLIVDERKVGRNWEAQIHSIRCDGSIEDWLEDIIARSIDILEMSIANFESMETLTGSSVSYSIRSKSKELVNLARGIE